MNKRIWLTVVSIGVFMAFSIAFSIGAVLTEGPENFADLSFDLAHNGYGTVLNPEGKGDVLIFPYYDVRRIGAKSQETYFAIINQTPGSECTTGTKDGVAAKLRFREWDKSEEVFDCDIWLSCNDVWVGVLVRDAATGLTRIISPDWVITGYTSSQFTVTKPLVGGFNFFTDFVPTPPVGTLTKADLTNMGYFEVIGEERTFGKQSGGKVTRLTVGRDAPNTLSGYAYIVRVEDGIAVGYNATAIANFVASDRSLFYSPGDVNPKLDQGDDGLAQLEFELSKANISHGYSIEPSIAGKFSMVITMPTKHFHFLARPRYTLNPSLHISRPFTGDHANFGELVQIKIFDREENPYTPEVGWWSPKTTEKIVIPTEVSIVGLYKGTPPTLPAPGQRDTVGFTTGGFETGWIWINLTGDGSATTHFATKDYFEHFGQNFSRYDGLPVIALAYQEFANMTAGGPAAAGYYGALFPMFYEVAWYLEVQNGDE